MSIRFFSGVALGLRFDALDLRHLNAIVVDSLIHRRKTIIANHNLHSLALVQHDAAMKAFYRRASFVHVDGMAVVMLLRLLGLPMKRRHRVTYVDWFPDLLRIADARRLRVYYLGSKSSVIERSEALMRAHYPGITWLGHNGYFDSRTDSLENRRLIQAIADFKPHFVFIGMGMPRQERWLLENNGSLPSAIYFQSGAALDYLVGEVPTPPRWLSRLGFEWLYRLMSEPRRLSRRYLIEPLSLIPAIRKDYMRRISGSPSLGKKSKTGGTTAVSSGE